ncbi:MAG TPA: hypothetical protein VHZ95_02485, partial [Polyangiales bacterium]|nr:hypothetical protein [Polyangiales bacterium]
SLDLIHFSRFHQPSSVDSSAFGDAMLDRTGLLVSTFRVLPSTLCLFFTLNDLARLSGADTSDEPNEPMPRSKLAICFASLESEDVDLQAIRFTGTTSAGTTSQVQSLQRRWNRTYVGPTYSTYLTDAIAIGGSLQFAYSYNSFGIDSTSLSDRLGGGSIASALGTSGSGFSFELTAIVGATYRYENFTLGASLRVPSLHLLGNYDGTLNRSTSGADNDAALTTNAHGTMRTSPPIRAAIGGGFTWERLTVELDAAIDIPIDDELTGTVTETQISSEGPDSTVTETRSHAKYAIANHPVVNPSLGLEYFINPTFSVLGGAGANFSTLDAIHPAASVGNLVQARNSHVNASLGMGSYWNGGSLLFGFQFDFGWGQSLAVNPYAIPNAWSVVPMKSYALTFVISGATDLNAILHVVRRITGDDQSPPPKAAAVDTTPAQR